MKKNEQVKIEVTQDGPYLASGNLPLSDEYIVTNAEGDSLDYKEGKKYPAQPQYYLCRCGQSAKKPFRDGSHAKVQFDGTETASRQPYLEQAETIDGPAVALTDAESLCAFVRFCDPKGRIWNLIARADDPETRKIVEFEAAHCPAGRLVVWDKKTGKPIEPHFQPSLGLIEDTEKKVSGPIWVRGGIPVVSANGKADMLAVDSLSSEQIMAEARDLHSRWPKMNQDERRKMIEILVKTIIIGNGEITLNLCYLPTFEQMTTGQRIL
jgi:CDGSH-type Zn-finger protein